MNLNLIINRFYKKEKKNQPSSRNKAFKRPRLRDDQDVGADREFKITTLRGPYRPKAILSIALLTINYFNLPQSIILICLYTVRKQEQSDIFLIHPRVCLNKLPFGLNALINGGQEHLSS